MAHAHDLRTVADEGVELIVRPNNRYGKALAGETVLVDKSELSNSSTMSSCMTFEDAIKLDDERKAKEAAAIEAKKESRKITNMVEAGLERIQAAVEAAKAKAEAEADESDRLEAARERQAADLKSDEDLGGKKRKSKLAEKVAAGSKVSE